MKRTLLEGLPFIPPAELEGFLRGARIYDSSCSPEARVYFIDKDGGYYLKTAKKGTLEREVSVVRLTWTVLTLYSDKYWKAWMPWKRLKVPRLAVLTVRWKMYAS